MSSGSSQPSTVPAVPRVGLSLMAGGKLSLACVIDLARMAERYGYDSIWVPETWGQDAVTTLAAIGMATSRIRLASGVLNVFSRTPALIAQTAATLQELSGGRFLLGLGTSGRGVVEPWHGVAYEKPLLRTRQYVEVIKLALGGAPVEHSSPNWSLTGFRLANPPRHPVPIYIAALGPRNCRLTGEIADGWLPIFAPRGSLGELFAEVREGASYAGRDPESIDVAAYIPAVVGPSAEILLRQQVAYYVGGMGDYYLQFVSRAGLAKAAEEIRRLWEAGDRRGAMASVADELLERCTLGTVASDGQSRLEGYRGEGVSLPIVALPRGCGPDEAAETIAAYGPVSPPTSPNG